jgi:hypothetical protein
MVHHGGDAYGQGRHAYVHARSDHQDLVSIMWVNTRWLLTILVVVCQQTIQRLGILHIVLRFGWLIPATITRFSFGARHVWLQSLECWWLLNLFGRVAFAANGTICC